METVPLLDLMTQEAEAERGVLAAKAEAEAEKILQDAKARAKKRHEDNLAALGAELDAQAKRSRERVEAEAHMILLTTKDTITDELLAAVRRQLDDLVGSSDFESVLETLLAELLQDAPEGIVVVAPPDRVDFCRQWLDANGHGELPVEALDSLKGGVAIQDEKRSFRVTNTLEARFLKQEGALRKFCLAELFGDSQGAQ